MTPAQINIIYNAIYFKVMTKLRKLTLMSMIIMSEKSIGRIAKKNMTYVYSSKKMENKALFEKKMKSFISF